MTLGQGQPQPQSFVLDFVELCEGTEVPDQFAVWTGLAGVSAALGRNVWCDLGVLTVFPNLYVVLIAGSGQKKSTSIEFLEPILYGMEPRPNLIAQKITPEALFEAMRCVDQNNPKQLGKETATGFIILDELTSLMSQQSYELLSPALLQFYNCKKEFKYATKTAGITYLKETCLGFIAATTPSSLSRAIPATAIGDGLTSRINFIYSKKPQQLVPIPFDTPRKRELRDRLGRSIARIAMLRGRAKLDDEATEELVRDYMEFHSDAKNPLRTNPLLDGYTQRHQGHCLKVAMLLACSEEQLTITREHVLKAMSLVNLYEAELPSLMALVSSTEHGLATQMIFEMICNNHHPTRADILRNVANRLSSRELDSVLDTLERAGMIKTEVGPPLHYRAIIK